MKSVFISQFSHYSLTRSGFRGWRKLRLYRKWKKLFVELNFYSNIAMKMEMRLSISINMKTWAEYDGNDEDEEEKKENNIIIVPTINLLCLFPFAILQMTFWSFEIVIRIFLHLPSSILSAPQLPPNDNVSWAFEGNLILYRR